MIDRVSTLFQGHPSLIQGFNTFLPPGYRIECFGGEGDSEGRITVTTPTGTVSQVPGNFAAAFDEKNREAGGSGSQQSPELGSKRRKSPVKTGSASTSTAGKSSLAVSLKYVDYAAGPPPLKTTPTTCPSPFGNIPTTTIIPTPKSTVTTTARIEPPPPATPGPLPIPLRAQQLVPPSGPSTPSAAQFLASGGLNGSHTATISAFAARAGAPYVEFNHAISFVNKIKTRFNNDPETYKQFLEILQTYQRDTRDIAEVIIRKGGCKC